MFIKLVSQVDRQLWQTNKMMKVIVFWDLKLKKMDFKIVLVTSAQYSHSIVKLDNPISNHKDLSLPQASKDNNLHPKPNNIRTSCNALHFKILGHQTVLETCLTVDRKLQREALFLKHLTNKIVKQIYYAHQGAQTLSSKA